MAHFRTRVIHITILHRIAPTEESKEETKNNLYEELESLIGTIKNQDIVILMGDMNLKVGRDNSGFEGIMGR